MIEIRIYKEGRQHLVLGEFSPKDVRNTICLLKEFPLEDADGDTLVVRGIHFDIGVSPHIAVLAELAKESADE